MSAAPIQSEQTRTLAIQANNRSWELLAEKRLSPAQSMELLASSYASLYLWDKVGSDVNRARAHWLVSRVHCLLGNGVLSRSHAELCRELTTRSSESKDFDHAFAAEAQARSFAVTGDLVAGNRWLVEAQKLGEHIADAEDRQIFKQDFSSGPWFGLDPLSQSAS